MYNYEMLIRALYKILEKIGITSIWLFTVLNTQSAEEYK